MTSNAVLGFSVGQPLPERIYYVDRGTLEKTLIDYNSWIIGFETRERCLEFYSNSISSVTVFKILGAKLAALGGVYAITDGGASPQDAQDRTGSPE